MVNKTDGQLPHTN